MAVTFTVSGLQRNVIGSKREHLGKLTLSGTTTDNGDAVTPALFGLSVLDELTLDPFVDSPTSPTVAAEGVWFPSTGKIAFFGGAASGSPQAELTGGSTVTNYFANFRAVGR